MLVIEHKLRFSNITVTSHQFAVIMRNVNRESRVYVLFPRPRPFIPRLPLHVSSSLLMRRCIPLVFVFEAIRQTQTFETRRDNYCAVAMCSFLFARR